MLAPRSAALTLAATMAACVALPSTASAVRAPDGPPERPEFDSRLADPASVDARTRASRGKADAGLGRLGTVATDRRTGGVANYQSIDGFLTAGSDRDAAAVVLGFVGARDAVFGLDDGDLDALAPVARDVSPDGITHLRWVQTTKGIPSYDSGVEGHVDAKGRLIAVQGGAQSDLALTTTEPALSATQALAAARQDAGGSGVAPAATGGTGAERRTLFATGERASLVAFATGDGATLAWKVVVDGVQPYLYTTVVDAATGEVLLRTGLTEHLSEANTVDQFPGAAGASGLFRVQSLTDDATWLNDSVGNTRLAGNNTHAYTDRNANNTADGGATDGDVLPGVSDGDGGPDWLFTRSTAFPGGTPCPANGSGCSWDSTSNATQDTNRAQATSTLFVQTNRFHDYLKGNGIGFDEASGNFQQVNPPGQGLGGDRVLAEGNDGAGINNANFTTPPDGTSPRMQMFMWSVVDVNGSDDATVIAHEYGHGLTNRLVTNAAGGGTIGASAQGGAMGEAYSDFYAMDWLAFQGFLTDTATPGEIAVGKYVFNNEVSGIRDQAMDCAVTDTTSPSCQGAGNGGYELQDVAVRSFPHDAGEIWSQVLWQLRQRIAASDGVPALSVAEHTELMQLVTGGLRLAPDGPNFLSMRDALLQQAGAMGGARYQLLWEIFLDRDMGVGATTDGVNAATGSTTAPDGVRHRQSVVVDDFAAGGDDDGAVEPGETFAVREVLENIGFTPESPITGTVSSSTPGTTILAGSSAWPAIPGSLGTGTNIDDFRVTAPAGASCTGDDSIALTVDITTPDGPLSVPVTVPVGPTADYTVGPATEGGPLAIPDGSPAGVSKTIVVPTSATITDLNVRVNVTHTWVGDLVVTLRRDGGAPVALIDRPGFTGTGFGNSGDNLTDTVLDDEAPTEIETASSAQAPFTGRFRPNQPLSVFDGQDAAATWTITVSDNAATDAGSFVGANLNLPGPAACDVSRPVAQTGDASAVVFDGATVTGVAGAGPGGVATQSRFAYGTTPAYGSTADAGDVTAASGQARSVPLTGLLPNTTYHYRLETLRGGAVAVAGADRTFTTPSAPPPPPAPDTAGTGTVATPPIVPTPTVTPGPSDPGLTAGIRFTGTPKRITLSSKGTFGLRFGATGGTKGALSIKATVPGKRNKRTKRRARSTVVTLVSRKAFTADAKGNVVFKTVTASKAAFRKLPKTTRTFSAVLEVKVGTKTFTHRFTFQRAKKKVAKRR